MSERDIKELFDTLEKIYLKNLVQDDLTIAESIALHVVFQLKSPTIIELAKALKISQSNATYLIQKLIGRGYLKRIRSEEDRREYHLEVTEKFDQTLNTSRALLKESLKEQLNKYKVSDQQVIQDFYREVINNVKTECDSI